VVAAAALRSFAVSAALGQPVPIARDFRLFRGIAARPRLALPLQSPAPEWASRPCKKETVMINVLAQIRFRLRSILRDTRGANMVEYMVIVGVVALLGIAAFTAFGEKIQEKIKEEGTKVSGIKTG
jgi:Flp pilus assembly pilin Flp